MDVVDAVHGHSDSFTIREFMQCLAVVVNSRHSMDGMPLLPETQLAEDIIRQCKEKGISRTALRAARSAACVRVFPPRVRVRAWLLHTHPLVASIASVGAQAR